MPEPMPAKHDSTAVMLAQAKLQLMRFARSAIDPEKVAIANRLTDEVRVLEAMEGSEVSRG